MLAAYSLAPLSVHKGAITTPSSWPARDSASCSPTTMNQMKNLMAGGYPHARGRVLRHSGRTLDGAETTSSLHRSLSMSRSYLYSDQPPDDPRRADQQTPTCFKGNVRGGSGPLKKLSKPSLWTPCSLWPRRSGQNIQPSARTNTVSRHRDRHQAFPGTRLLPSFKKSRPQRHDQKVYERFGSAVIVETPLE